MQRGNRRGAFRPDRIADSEQAREAAVQRQVDRGLAIARAGFGPLGAKPGAPPEADRTGSGAGIDHGRCGYNKS